MADDVIELIEAPETCEETIEFDNSIEDELEPELEEEEEQESTDSYVSRNEIEHQFARFESNYRARRLRELTTAPIKKKMRPGRKPRAIAA